MRAELEKSQKLLAKSQQQMEKDGEKIKELEYEISQLQSEILSVIGVLEVLDQTGARISGPHFDGNVMTLPDRVPEGDTDSRSAFMSHLDDVYSSVQRSIDE